MHPLKNQKKNSDMERSVGTIWPKVPVWLWFSLFSFILSACGPEPGPGEQDETNKSDSPNVYAIINVAEKQGVAPFRVDFRADSSYAEGGSLIAYRWAFPDGVDQIGELVTYTFQQSGSYTVELEVEDDSGQSDIARVTINVVDRNDRFDISGTVSSMAYTDVDSDINDPNAPYSSNDGGRDDEVQELKNPVNLSGFASNAPTRWPGDRFDNDADEQDHFRIHLEDGDYVSLVVGDYLYSDLDLYLYAAGTMDLVSYSDSGSDVESLQVQEDGDYIVVVEAVRGFTSYRLSVGADSVITGLSAQGNSADFAENQVILKMKESSGPELLKPFTEDAQIETSHRRTHRAMLGRINPLNPQTHNKLWGKMREEGFGARLLKTNPVSAAKLKTIKAIKRFRAQEGVQFAEPNYRIDKQLTPTDPYFDFQWYLQSLQLPQVWDVTIGDPDVVIAVVDTGIYLNHPDLRDQLVDGYDFISEAENAGDGDGLDPDPSDMGTGSSFSSWHGTHVTGIAVAEMNNFRGVVGVAPGSRVMPLRAIGAEGGLTYDVMQAVRFAAGLENDSGTVPVRPADIINLSLGGEGYSAAPSELYKELYDRGIFVVASSGNQNTGMPMYPASYEGVISVGSATLVGERASYSNTGLSLDIMAYGGDMSSDENNDGYLDGILSTLVFEDGFSLDADYSLSEGTSMASPQVSAVIALMKAAYPQLTPELFDSLLINGQLTNDSGAPGRDNEFGYGIIDGLKALEAAQELANGSETAAVVADRIALVFDRTSPEKSLRLKSIGNGNVAIESIVASESWIQASPVDVSNDGMGTYLVTIESDGLETDYNHRAYFEVKTSQGDSMRIDVLLRAGRTDSLGNAGYIYILLVDADSGELADGLDVPVNEGLYEFEFESVPVGHYYITAGSDVDNDGLVCGYGESCGMYPNMESFEIFHVTRDRDDLDFDVGLYSANDFLSIQSLFGSQRRK